MSSSRVFSWSAVYLPILGAVIAGLIVTATVHSSGTVKIIAYISATIVLAIFISSAVASTKPPEPTPVLPSVKATEDPFTYDPGATFNGEVIFSGNGSAFANEYNCTTKSANTRWEAALGACQCKLGFYGTMCEFEGFSDGYVSLTTTTPFTTDVSTPRITLHADSLSVWSSSSGSSTTQGCTNMCDVTPNCLGVTYSNHQCTQILAPMTFATAPIQNTDLNPPILPTTLYLNRGRLQGITMTGYFNIIFGVLPARYFVGNDVATSTTGSGIHVTTGGTRIGYYTAGMQYSFTGIPDFIIVNNAGVLNLSTTTIPPKANIVPGNASLVQFTTPILITKSNFPFGDPTITYNVRLDSF